MKKLILCMLLLTAFSNPIYSQDSVKWITPEQEARVFMDRAIIKAQSKKIREQTALIDSLNRAYSDLRKDLNETILQQRKELDRIKKLYYRDSAKISTLEMKLGNEVKRTAGYQQIAKDISLRLTEMKKWRGKYYTLASLTLFKITIPLAGFLAGTYIIMKMIN